MLYADSHIHLQDHKTQDVKDMKAWVEKTD